MVAILFKGGAGDNKLSSRWTTQMGLRLKIGRFDKEKGGEIKPSRQNGVSRRPKKDFDNSSHTVASGKVCQDMDTEQIPQ